MSAQEICYGASVRLINVWCKAQLTADGQSGLQKVIARVRTTDHPDPHGSAGVWLVKGAHARNARMNCKYGAPVVNGDIIRLEHITTQIHLHVPDGTDTPQEHLKEGSECDNWRVVVEDGGHWAEWTRVMLVHDNSNNNICIFPNNKNLQITVVTPRETQSWWLAEVVNPSWKVPFYTLEPLNHDLEVKPPFVVFGSAICLQNLATRRHLSSSRGFQGHHHFTESGQQQLSSVSIISTSTVWVVKGRHRPGDRYNFTPKMVVRNGDVIRLEHYNSQANLHSHHGHRSACAKQQEATCYGVDGVGDTNDEWRVEVMGGETVWGVKSNVRLVHVTTGHVLHSDTHPLNQDNMEVNAIKRRDANSLWVVVFLELFY